MLLSSLIEKVSRIDGAKSVIRLVLAALLVMLPEATAVAQTADPPPPAVTTCSGGMAGTYPCSNIDLMSFLALDDIGGGSGNDIWGWTDSSTGEEYAIMGRTNGTSFVDISDPVNPIYLGNLPPHSANSTWRDIKVYADHAFIVTEADNSGMQVFDLTQLREVASPPATFSETAHYSGFGDAHNLAINEGSGFAYAVGTNNCGGGLHMINIQTPTNPTSAGCFSADGFTHDAQCVDYDGPDLDHQGKEICFNSNVDTLTIVDVTNKAVPAMLSRTGYSGSGYTHQGWLTEDQVYFLLGDELDERDATNTRTYMWDVSDLDDPALIGFHESTTTATDHNQYVKGSYTYQSNYRAGLRILDITDIANGNLSEEAFFDIYPDDDSPDFNGAWSNYPFFNSGIVIVSGEEQGLFVLRPNLVTASVSGVRVINITQTGAMVTVTIANPGSSQKTVYLRYRTTPNGAWSATQEDRGSAASRTFALSKLAAETEYGVEASRDSRFPADSRVSVTFTTLAGATAPTVLSITSDATHPTKNPFTVTITFSEAVTGLTAGEIAVTNGAGSSFAGTGASYTLDIEPSPDIEGNVTVRVPANAAVDGANLGNVEGSETFAVDTRAPTVETVRITSNAGSDSTYAAEETIEVTVTFNETVVVMGTPRLTLNVGGRSRTANYQSVTGGAVKFEYQVVRGDGDEDGVSIDTNSLSRGGGTIRDGARNDATLDHAAGAADSRHKVDGVPPVLANTDPVVVNGATLTLTYNEPLNGSSRPATSDFTVSGGNETRTVTRVWVSGSAGKLTLSPAVEHGETGIRVSYRPGANPIRDVAGNDAEALTDQEVENKTVDTKAPVLEGIEISSNPGEDETYAAGEAIAVRVRFSETVTVDTTDGTPTLNLTVGGQSKPARYRPGPDSAAVVFVYRVKSGDIDTDGVSIAAGRIKLNGGTIQDLADNPAALAYEAVAADSGHKVDGVKPVLQGATVHAARLVQIYHEALDEDSTPSRFDFTVMVAGSARTVTQVLVSGSGVTLTLASPVAAGEAVTVSYTPGFNPIQDPVGNAAEGLTDETALPPLVTISAQDDPASVPEGTAADFTLTREPPTTTTLTAGISITERGSVIETEGSYEPPKEVTFTAGDATAILMVLTDDDDQQEEDGSIIATLQPGAGYRLGEVLTQTAEVTITDDDGAPIPPGGGGGGGGSGGVRQTVPDAPRNLRADGTNEAVTLSWDAPENDGGFAITDYEYRINGAGRGWTSIGSTHTTHTVTGLVNGRVYVFRVRAVNAAGNSAHSNWAEATPELFTLDFAHFANGDGIASDLVFVNVGTHPIRPALYFYDQEGEPMAAESVVDIMDDLEIQEDGSLSIQTAMEPLGELTVSTHGQGELVSGSARVVAFGAIGGVLRFDLPGIGVAGVGASPPVRDAVFPVRRQEAGINTGVAIHNLESSPEIVWCELMSGGTVLEEEEIPLAANGQSSWFIDAAFPTADTSGFVGSVRCDAVGTGMFTAVALELDPGTSIFTTLPVFPVSRRSGGRAAELNFAHFANGDGLTSDLVFVNLSTERSRPAPTPFHSDILPARPALYFYDQEGQPIAAESVVDITGDLEVMEDGGLTVRTEMEPLGVLTISTHGQGELVSGSARVVAFGAIGGVLRFDLPGIGVAGVGASHPVRDALFPARRQEGGINTGVAVHNLGEEAMEVTCELMRGGTVLDDVSIPLAANGQSSWFINEMFTGSDTSDFVGSVRCTAPGEGMFTGVALELDAANRIFTTLPVVPVPERTSQE